LDTVGEDARSLAMCVTAAAALAVVDCATSAWVACNGSAELLNLLEDGFVALAASIHDVQD
jgi:hypothetical protein